jgi:exonuclease VII small subunit
MKQTAVEWLKGKTSDMTIHKTHLNDTISEWQDGYNVALEDVIKLFQQALEMEKQQIVKAYKDGVTCLPFDDKDVGEQYYDYIYKIKKS